jgi:hypothetical protein
MEVRLSTQTSTKVACHWAKPHVARMDIVGLVTVHNSLGRKQELYKNRRAWAHCILLGKNTSSHQVALSLAERRASDVSEGLR